MNYHLELRTTPPQIKSACQFLDKEEINTSRIQISSQKKGIQKIQNIWESIIEI